MRPYEVKRIITTHAGDYIARYSKQPWFAGMYNPPQSKPVSTDPSLYVDAHINNPNHGDECIIYPYGTAQNQPVYKGRNLLWYIYEDQNPGVDSKFRRRNKIETTCGVHKCINRNHIAVSPKLQKVRIEPVVRDDPLLKPWRRSVFEN